MVLVCDSSTCNSNAHIIDAINIESGRGPMPERRSADQRCPPLEASLSIGTTIVSAAVLDSEYRRCLSSSSGDGEEAISNCSERRNAQRYERQLFTFLTHRAEIYHYSPYSTYHYYRFQWRAMRDQDLAATPLQLAPQPVLDEN